MNINWRTEAADERYWDSVDFHEPFCHCGWCIAHTVEKAALDTVSTWDGVYTTKTGGEEK
jgi:hypothetical protein